MYLVFLHKHIHKQPKATALNETGVHPRGDFLTNNSPSRSHTLFRLAPNSTTLNDLELTYGVFSQFQLLLSTFATHDHNRNRRIQSANRNRRIQSATKMYTVQAAGDISFISTFARNRPSVRWR